jgi:hypothetical protein
VPSGGVFSWDLYEWTGCESTTGNRFMLPDGTESDHFTGDSASATIIAHGTSSEFDSDRVRVGYTVLNPDIEDPDPNDPNCYLHLSDKEGYTTFKVYVGGGGRSEINWDDDGPPITPMPTPTPARSDRRDGGADGGTVVRFADPDIGRVTVSMIPGGLLTNPETSNNTVTFSVEGETRCAALWGTNDRSSGAGAGSIPFTELPKTFYVEGLYPNSLDSNGEVSGSVDFKGECAIGGSKSTTIAKKRYCLDANCTFYTIPHEEEYTDDNVTTLTVCLYRNNAIDDETTTVSVKNEFMSDIYSITPSGVSSQGSGLIMHPNLNYSNYKYLRYQNDSWVVDTIARTATGTNADTTNNSTAKWCVTRLSGLDMPSSINIPRLQEMIYSDDYSKIIDAIKENRVIDDTGDGGRSCPQKWMDICVPYVPKNSRNNSCKNKTMKKICEKFGKIDSIYVDW